MKRSRKGLAPGSCPSEVLAGLLREELFVKLVALVALSVILIAGVLWLNDSSSVDDVYKNMPQRQFLFRSQTGCKRKKKEDRIIFIEE